MSPETWGECTVNQATCLELGKQRGAMTELYSLPMHNLACRAFRQPHAQIDLLLISTMLCRAAVCSYVIMFAAILPAAAPLTLLYTLAKIKQVWALGAGGVCVCALPVLPKSCYPAGYL